MVTILIADDEPLVVDLVRVTLEDNRVRVFEASDGGAALAIAEALSPDLVLLDVHLPVVTGFEICRLLRKHPHLASTKIVVLTAAGQHDDIARGFTAGATDFLAKPFSPVRLLSLVERLMPRLTWPSA